MATGSFIEMFMTTFGWHLYEIVWGIISSTGLAYLPFFAVIIDNVIKPIESQEAKAAAVTSLRRLEIDIIRLIFMMILAVSPYMTIQFGAISYTKACQADTGTPGETIKAGNSGTRFDSIFKSNLLNNQEAKAPPWFYIVMSITGGINDAVIVRLPCEINMRQAAYEMSSTNIQNPHLKRQTERFVKECYKPAVADFYNERRQLPDEFENNDIDWPGSKYFNQNYYNSAYAKHQVPGFRFDKNRESDKAYVSKDQEGATPEYGYPSCSEWWNSPQGIKAGLVEEFPAPLMHKITTWTAESSLEAENQAIRQMLKNEGPEMTKGLDISGNGKSSDLDRESFTDAIYDVGGALIGTAGVWLAEVLIAPVTYAVTQMAPYVQATMLMTTYFLLPWVLIVGNYSWSTIKTATITIFAVKFWTSIWAVADFLDNKLAQVLSEASGNSGIMGFFDHQNQLMASMIDIIMLGIYTAVPYYFLQMLGWAGEHGASAPTSTTSAMTNEGRAAGQKGASIAEGAITK